MFKFSKLHHDPEIQKIQQESQDNFATRSDVSEKAGKAKSFVAAEPVLTNMSDGDRIPYDDGTNKWIYERIGAKLWKYQLTEVA